MTSEDDQTTTTVNIHRKIGEVQTCGFRDM